jgi:general secretion pathway protein C
MALEQVLKRNFWVVTGLLVAGAAYLHARAIAEIVEAKVAPDGQLLVARSAPHIRSAPPPSDHATSATAILERNPFDSVTGPLDRFAIAGDADGGTDGAASSGSRVDLGDPSTAPPCEGVKVHAIAESADPDWSFAALADATDGKSVLRRRGGEVGGKTVEFVGPDRVWLSGPTGLCQTRLFDLEAKQAPKVPPPAPVAVNAPARGGGVDPAISKGIQRISATEFNIDRGVVDRILENQAELMRQARIVPEQENGKMVGIRLFGVRADTLLGVLGMQNGDRLQTINGFDMTSPEKALEAYARLRTADHLTVQVNRGGQNVNIDYAIK